MFMVDNSASTGGTDPNLSIRVATIQKFIRDYGSHTNLTYSFGYFGGNSAKEFDETNRRFVSSPVDPFGGSDFLSDALNAYKRLGPSGTTPYVAAFNSLKSVVAQDEANGTKQNYVVVFMSDGMPTDISGNQPAGIIQLVDQLRTAVQQNGSLMSISSVYFGSAIDHSAINNLSVMASEGQGQFVNTNETTSLVINDVISVPGSCQ
jgi:hypothetical protein